MPDSEIIRLILSKDERGLAELLNRYGPLIRYVITPILKSPEDVEECLSDIVMRVWDKIRLYDSSCGSFKGWLTAVSRIPGRTHGKLPGRIPYSGGGSPQAGTAGKA